MLVISRRKGQRITIGDEIELVVTELHRSNVKLGISAPRGYAVLRGEVHESIKDANKVAAESALDETFDLEVFANARSTGPAPTELLSPRQGDGTEQRQKRDANGPEIIRRRPRRAEAQEPPPSDPAEVR